MDGVEGSGCLVSCSGVMQHMEDADACVEHAFGVGTFPAQVVHTDYGFGPLVLPHQTVRGPCLCGHNKAITGLGSQIPQCGLHGVPLLHVPDPGGLPSLLGHIYWTRWVCLRLFWPPLSWVQAVWGVFAVGICGFFY